MKKIIIAWIIFVGLNLLCAQDCPRTNIYKTMPYHKRLAPRTQSQRTCFAEAMSYAYNVQQMKSEDFLHPFYALILGGDGKDLWSGGNASWVNKAIFCDNKICSYGSIENLLSLFARIVIEEFEIYHWTYNDYENDFLNILKEIHATVVTHPATPDINSIFQEVIEEYFGREFKNPKSSLERLQLTRQIAQAFSGGAGMALDEFLLRLLNASCTGAERQQMRVDLLDSDVVYSLEGGLAKITNALKNGNPVLLNLSSAKPIANETVESHAVVAMGSKISSQGNCQLLIHNSWGERYDKADQCFCYDHVKKSYSDCSYQQASDQVTLDIVACWYDYKNKDNFLNAIEWYLANYRIVGK